MRFIYLLFGITRTILVLELEARAAAAALHDSSERWDEPKCHPNTRMAVQDEIYSWIIGEDNVPEPKKIKWITGPAGAGKTAIMGSVAESCAGEGILAASFFFSARSPSLNRRQKTAFVPTLAYQLSLHDCPELRDAIADAVDQNPLVFDKNLHVQMETLVLAPLRWTKDQPGCDRSRWPSVILVDGLDECDVELYRRSQDQADQVRAKEEDQLEILQVLYNAAQDPAFPFRIIIASRPERIFREFLSRGRASTVSKLDLDEEYNADQDIAVFLESKFAEIRRRYHLSHWWYPPDAIPKLVRNASGQFIYAATVIRFIEDRENGNPEPLLRLVLDMEDDGNRSSTSLQPFAHLDALYSRVLWSSPDPVLAARWIWFIVDGIPDQKISSCEVNQLLQTAGGEAERLLGDLHSLIKIPPYGDHESPYELYHKSLIDFITNYDRSGELFVDFSTGRKFVLDRYFEVCRSE